MTDILSFYFATTSRTKSKEGEDKIRYRILPKRIKLRPVLITNENQLESTGETAGTSRKKKSRNRSEVEEILTTLLESSKSELQHYVEKPKDASYQNSIDKKDYIKENLKCEPENSKKYKSIDIQIQCMGEKKYRDNLIRGVNEYELNGVKCARLGSFKEMNEKEIAKRNRKIEKKLGLDLTSKPEKRTVTNYRRNIHLKFCGTLPPIADKNNIDERLAKSMKSAKKMLSYVNRRREELRLKKKAIMEQ